MNVFMVTLGTRGDLDPFIILGTELRERGHRVVIGTSTFYEAAVRKAGMEWTQVGNGTYEQLLEVLDTFNQIPDKKARIDEYAAKWLLPQFQMSQDHIRVQAQAADYFINNLNLTYPRGKGFVPGGNRRHCGFPGREVVIRPPAIIPEGSRGWSSAFRKKKS
jgi:hypothetical protein